MMLMLLTAMKYGGHWDILGRIFKIKVPTFERIMSKFVSLISDHVYTLLVSDLKAEFSLTELCQSNQRFCNFPEAPYAADVTFQQPFRPSGAISEGKLYFSGKHKLYGVKNEVSVLSNGLAATCSSHYPNSVSDFETT